LRRKTAVPVKLPIAPILPFMALITPAPATRPNPGGYECDQLATISKLKDGGFESLTTRLRPAHMLELNKQLEV
jgi:hypothetical protein